MAPNPKFVRIYDKIGYTRIDDLSEMNEQIHISGKVILSLCICIFIAMLFLISLMVQYSRMGTRVNETNDSIYVEKANPLTGSSVIIRYKQKEAIWYITDTAFIHQSFFTKEFEKYDDGKYKLHFEGKPVSGETMNDDMLHVRVKNYKKIPKHGEKVQIVAYEWPMKMYTIE